MTYTAYLTTAEAGRWPVPRAGRQPVTTDVQDLRRIAFFHDNCVRCEYRSREDVALITRNLDGAQLTILGYAHEVVVTGDHVNETFADMVAAEQYLCDWLDGLL